MSEKKKPKKTTSKIEEKIDELRLLIEKNKLITNQRKIIFFLISFIILLIGVLLVDNQTGDVIFPALKDHILMPGLDLTDQIVQSYFHDDVWAGDVLAALGVEKKYPVVMIPGFITTGLELWQGDPCAMKYFRQRMWGTLSMMQSMIRDPHCWMRHMALDGKTGLDPEGIKLRPAYGLEAADYLFPGYWVWGKLIQNLAKIGYDSNDFYMASYDWRLALFANQERDNYFETLMRNIEILHKKSKEKVVVTSHSMGSILALNFFKYADNQTEMRNWVDTHIDSFINIGGPLLGSTKSLSSFLSGEMKDTTNFVTLQNYILDPIVSKVERMNVMRSWLGVASMIPMGGVPIWGSTTSAPDEDPMKVTSAGNIISLKLEDGSWRNMTADEAAKFVIETLEQSENERDHYIAKNIQNTYSYGVATKETGFPGEMINISGRQHLQQDKKFWTNPLESQLPYAPKMKIYCIYGVGKDTERGYVYSHAITDELRYSIDVKYTNLEDHITAGVRNGKGDGTIPLVSLGYMCVDGWKNEFYNPSKMNVYTREYQHTPNLGLRGGANTGDHVDIMGNYGVSMDILKIVSGSTEIDRDNIVSDIKEIASKINLP